MVTTGVEILKKAIALGIMVTKDHPYVLFVLGFGFALVLIVTIVKRFKAMKCQKEDKTTKSKKKAK